MALFTAVAFYNRSSQTSISEESSHSDKTPGRGQHLGRDNIKPKYLCLLCGSQVSDLACKTCGSRMKKPVF